MRSKLVSLSKNEDFKSILSGRKISNKYLTIFFKKLSDKNNKKLNISFVAKKKIGNAVSRNKIKRRLRNIMNDATKTMNLNLNYCYLLIARISILKDPYENIKQTLFNDFGKIK
jgi:ribonuclease P protein component